MLKQRKSVLSIEKVKRLRLKVSKVSKRSKRKLSLNKVYRPNLFNKKRRRRISRLRRGYRRCKEEMIELIANTPILIKKHQSVKRFKKRRKTRIARLKRRINRRIRRSFITTKRKRIRRNLLRKSYFYRYILRRHKRVYKRTIGLLLCQPLYYQDELYAFEQLQTKLRLRRRSRKRIMYKRQRTLQTKRAFTFGYCYICYRKRNLFITIFKLISVQYRQKIRLMLTSKANTKAFSRYKLLHRLDKKQVFKCTGALTGYTGPKRTTKLGRESVAKAAVAFLYNNQFTCVDLIFTKHLGRFFSFIIRGLLLYPIFIRHIYISKRRSHGFTRLKKIRRT